MNLRRPILTLFAALLVGQLLVPNVAHAYLDPGTGSFMLQMLVGALLGGLFAVGIFWKKVVAFVKRLFSGKKDADGEGEPREPKGGATPGD